MKVLVVCTGNKFRSPIVAAMLRKLGVGALSAGVSPNIKGDSFPKKTHQTFARLELNMPIMEFRSRPVTGELVTWADKVIYMQPSHKIVLDKYTVHLRNNNKLVCLADFAVTPLTKIPDPAFDKDNFDVIVLLMQQCVDRFV